MTEMATITLEQDYRRLERRPYVRIAFIGTNYLAGVKEAAKECSRITHDVTGWNVDVWEIHNVCITPFHGLGAMRNQAIVEAALAGVTHILIIDNDMLIEDMEMLSKLVSRHVLAVTPYFDQSHILTQKDDGSTTIHRFARPMLAPKQGIHPLDWCAVNCVLFDMRAFHTLGYRVFTDPMISNEDEYIWSWAKLLGVQLFQDTDVSITALRAPTKIWEAMGQPSPNPLVETH